PDLIDLGWANDPNVAGVNAMLSPRGILDAPGHVGAAALRGAGSSGIKVTYAQTMSGVELVVHLPQIFVEVKWGGNIALPSCVAVWEGNVGQGNVGICDRPRGRSVSLAANYVSDSVADECRVSGRIGRFGCRGSKIAGAFQRGGN